MKRVALLMNRRVVRERTVEEPQGPGVFFRAHPFAAPLLLAGMLAGRAFAGATVEVGEEGWVEFGLRIQPQFIVTERDLDADGAPETETDFKLRRARFYLKGRVMDQVGAFLQTEAGSGEGGAGRDWRLVDAFVTLDAHSLLSLHFGQHMVPSSRQGVTSMFALMAIDRPGINYKALTWGTRSMTAFSNNTYADGDSGLRGEVAVRDTGATLLGNYSFNENLHLKYYTGVYDGIQLAGTDNPRLTGRAQLNLFDAEKKYFQNSTYLGEKRTISLGASFDHQSDVADDVTMGPVDYSFYTIDVFGEYPVGPGHLNLEAAYETLDLGGATALDHDGDAETTTRDASGAEGRGCFAQVGYLLGRWQPWAAFEHWSSESTEDLGTYNSWRWGCTYYIRGHSANLKAGFERFEPTVGDSIDSFIFGCYVAY